MLIQNVPQNYPLKGAWETKISNREKRQQRRKEKGPGDDSGSPGGGNHVVQQTEHPVVSAPVSTKKNKGKLFWSCSKRGLKFYFQAAWTCIFIFERNNLFKTFHVCLLVESLNSKTEKADKAEKVEKRDAIVTAGMIIIK